MGVIVDLLKMDANPKKLEKFTHRKSYIVKTRTNGRTGRVEKSRVYIYYFLKKENKYIYTM